MTIILPVLYACETWPFALRKNLGQRVLQNRVLRDVFWPKHNEVTEDWRKLHNEDLHDLYISPNIIWLIKWRRMRWAGHVAHMGEKRNICRVLVRKPKGYSPLGGCGHRCEDNNNIRVAYRGGVSNTPPPEIPKISVESLIA